MLDDLILGHQRGVCKVQNGPRGFIKQKMGTIVEYLPNNPFLAKLI